MASGVTGVGASPPIAIGQWALLVAAPAGNVFWGMITYIDEDLAARIRELGGIARSRSATRTLTAR